MRALPFYAILLAAGALASASCGRSPAQPSPQTPPPSPATAVVITGIERFAFTALKPGETARLTATARLQDGTSSDCTQTAQWTSSDEQIVRFTRPGEVIATGPGQATIRAACGAAADQMSLIIRYSLRGVVRQPSGHPVAGAYVSSFQVNRSARADANGAFELTDLVARRFEASVSAVGYETTSHQLEWGGAGPLTSGVELLAAPLNGVELVEASGKICSYGPGHHMYPGAPDSYLTYCLPEGALRTEDRYYFTAPREGTLRVDTYWGLDYNDYLYIELWCGGSQIRKVAQRLGSDGKAFDIPASRGCAYELKLTQSSRYAYLAYRLRVTLIAER